jgi:hypothetical protein
VLIVAVSCEITLHYKVKGRKSGDVQND